jgi:hypothetical protein
MPRPVHFEFHSADPERSVAFFGDVFGWRTERWGDMPYWLQETGTDEPGIDGAIAPAEAHGQRVVLTIGVADLAAYVAKVAAAGGTIVQGRMPIPGIGWFAMAADPSDMWFGMLETDPSAGS